MTLLLLQILNDTSDEFGPVDVLRFKVVKYEKGGGKRRRLRFDSECNRHFTNFIDDGEGWSFSVFQFTLSYLRIWLVVIQFSLFLLLTYLFFYLSSVIVQIFYCPSGWTILIKVDVSKPQWLLAVLHGTDSEGFK